MKITALRGISGFGFIYPKFAGWNFGVERFWPEPVLTTVNFVAKYISETRASDFLFFKGDGRLRTNYISCLLEFTALIPAGWV